MLTQPPTPDTPAISGTRVFPAALLRHDVPEFDDRTNSHYDWMLADPSLLLPNAQPTPDSPWLWTMRVAIPSAKWRENDGFDVEPIQHHRWRYLTYEGPLTENRGSVTRVDEGKFAVLKWTEKLREIQLKFRSCRGMLRLEAVSAGRWRATWI